MNILKEKERSGLSYREIAEKCGMKRSYTCRAVMHPETVSYEAFMQVAKALDIPYKIAENIWSVKKTETATERVKANVEKKLRG